MKSINQQIINDLDKMVEEAQMAQHRSVDESLEISFNALEKAKKSGLHRQAANCLVLIGRSYWINGNFESALEYLDEALELCNKFQGDFIRVEAIIAIGNVYTTIEMFDLAVSNYNQALNIATVQGFDILVSKALNNIGAMHEELNNDSIALDYYHKSLIKSSKIDDAYGVAIANLNIGNMNFNLNHLEVAREYLNKAVLYSRNNDKTLLLAHSYFTLGSMAESDGNYDEAIFEFENGVSKALDCKDLKILFRTYIELGKTFNLKGSFDKAESTFLKGLDVANQMDIDELKVTIYEQMAGFYKENGNDEKSLEYYMKYNKSSREVENNRVLERRKTVDYLSKLSESREETKIFQSLSNELKRSYDNMRTLSIIGQTMTSTHEISKIFEKLYEDINSLMKADSLAVGLFDKEANSLRFDLSIERGENLGGHSLSLDNKKSFVVWSFLNRESVKVNDVETEYKKYIEGIASTKGILMSSVMVAPLIVEDEVIGVFSIQAKEKNSYTESHKVLLQTLASYLAISIRNATKTKQLAKLNKILKSKSEKDGLTGISNRRLFDEKYLELWNKSTAESKRISVMIIDIDNFKDFNDQFGHLIGDEVIKSVAELLEESCGEYGFVARYGGDEFVVVLENCTDDELAKIDQSIRSKLKKVHKNLNIDKEVTISSGLASIIPGDLDESEKLVYIADNQLYESKANGKNTISIKS